MKFIFGALVLLVADVSCQYRHFQIPDVDRGQSSALLDNIIRTNQVPTQASSFGSNNILVTPQTQSGTVTLPQGVLGQPIPVTFPGRSDTTFHKGSDQVAGGVFGQGVGSGQAAGAVFGQGVGSGQPAGAVFGQGVGSGQAAGAVFGQGVGSGQAARVVFGQNQAAVLGSGRFSKVSVPRVTIGSPEVRRVDALFTPTVTQVITIDRCVTVTDQAFNSVAVTLTSFSVQTVTVGTRAVLQTPVDDRVALQTSVFVRPGTVTLTEVKSDFRIVTETSLTHVTLAHTSYVISQYTFTTTATQVISYTATLVRTNISTQRTTITNYRTVTDTVFVNSGYGYRA
ncbi:uncharacterized protein [Procambarus clarkii]|uniref:uncharacterized protein n=1 Tax=Procambarus clarkii TaxID=6728 RepID=UPI0037432A9D